MKTQISINDWMEIQGALKKIDYWQECPPFASFSMAGETHTVYTDGKYTYKSVSGNGFCTYYKYDGEDSEQA